MQAMCREEKGGRPEGAISNRSASGEPRNPPKGLNIFALRGSIEATEYAGSASA